jgi:nicotinamide riboside transporter PnuC
MKLFKTSVTKIVLLLIVCSLITIELYKTFKGIELDQVFVDACIMIVSFYYWQKGMKFDKPDSIVEDLSNDNNNNGTVI